MPNVGDILERESRSVDLEQGDFERLLGRRERKERNRRIRAGAVGVIVALATGIVLVRSLTSNHVPANPPVEPRPSPAASGALAYALDGDIYVADPDGSNAVKIADAVAGCEGYGAPSWSPDGRYLAYRQDDCSRPGPFGDVVISDAEGDVLAAFPGEGWQIAWSPDSTRVAVWDVVFETIGVYGLDGVRQTQLAIPPGMTAGGDHDPVWMPDGTSLMVPNVEVPLDGGTPRPLPLPEDAGWTTYSPDGSHVAYVTQRGLTVARSDGSEPREVFGWAGSPAWSATGDRIAFTTHSPGRPWATNDLRVLDVASGSVTLLTEAERGSMLWVIGFSPQGDRILYSKDPGSGEASLWSIGVDGSDARLLVAGTSHGEWLSR